MSRSVGCVREELEQSLLLGAFGSRAIVLLVLIAGFGSSGLARVARVGGPDGQDVIAHVEPYQGFS